MAIDEALNKILKEMWRLDEKISLNEQLNHKESDFYCIHLPDIKNYYLKNSHYWNNKK